MSFRDEEEDVYQEHIMDHYEDPYHKGHCERATHSHQDKNPMCGDVIQVELQLNGDGTVVDAWFDGEGCCISQAAASMLIEEIEGKTVDEVRSMSADEMLKLFGPRLTPNRQKCCLLSWRMVQSALHSPINGDSDEEGGQGPTFSGPHLGEES